MKLISREHLDRLLEMHRTHREVAQAVGVSCASITRYIKRYGISRPRPEYKSKAGNAAWKALGP